MARVRQARTMCRRGLPRSSGWIEAIMASISFPSTKVRSVVKDETLLRVKMELGPDFRRVGWAEQNVLGTS